jgi:hypothetical protein
MVFGQWKRYKMVTIVVPCRGREDTIRVNRNLAPSVKKFVDIELFEQFVFICDLETKELLKPAADSLSDTLDVRFISDSDLTSTGSEFFGWGKQQFLKFQASHAVKSDWFLTLDSDCYFVKRCSTDDLFDDGLAYCNFSETCYHLKWWQAARNCMNLNDTGLYCGVTPFLFNRELCRSLLRDYDVEQMIFSTWHSNHYEYGATENSIYWTYLCNNYNYSDYYKFGQLESNAIWQSKAIQPDEILELIEAQFKSGVDEYGRKTPIAPISLTQSDIGFSNKVINKIESLIGAFDD